MPEKRIVIGMVVLILLGGVMVVIYGLLGGHVGPPVPPESSYQPAFELARQVAAAL